VSNQVLRPCARESLDPEAATARLAGGSVNSLREKRYAYFLDFEPAAMAGYSIYIYHFDKEDVEAWRRRAGIEEPVATSQRYGQRRTLF
jgi:hypothetical protein